MLSISLLKLLFAIAILKTIFIAAWFPFKLRKSNQHHIDFPIGETLATGIFLGAALLHMLPESNEMFNKLGYDYPFAFIITGKPISFEIFIA